MPGPITFNRLPGMIGVQLSHRISTGPGSLQRGMYFATDESGAPKAPGIDDKRTSIVARSHDVDPFDLARETGKDLEVLRVQGEQAVIERLSEDLQLFTEPADALQYLRNMARQGGSLEEFHFIFMQIDNAIEKFTRGDPFMRLGSTFDTACISTMMVYDIEMKYRESLSNEDREKIADMLYVLARRSYVQYREYEASLLASHDVIRRYEVLGLTEKAERARSWLDNVQSKLDRGVVQISALLREHFKDPAGKIDGFDLSRAEVYFENWASKKKLFVQNCLLAGYVGAAMVLETYATEFDKIDGAKDEAQSLRDKAAEYLRIGKALGLIED